MKHNFISGSVLALTLGVATLGLTYEQEPQPSPDTPQAEQSNQPQAATQAQSAQQFTGMIVKQGEVFMLKDSSGDLTYELDDHGKAKDYVGKQVKVTGTLDSSTHVLHVKSIQIVS
jgi:uncharacterized protein YdeI (BOF family)